MNRRLIQLWWQQLLLLCCLCASPSSQFYSLPTKESLSKMIYITYTAEDDPLISFCIGRFNATHQFGCSNSAHHQYGAPFMIHTNLSRENGESFQRALQLGATGQPLVLLIDVFDFVTIDKLKGSLNKLESFVAGIVFYHQPSSTFPTSAKFQSYSHDSTCPNTYYGFGPPKPSLNCSHHWVSSLNPYLNFAHTRWPFPIFYVRNTTVLDRLFYCSAYKSERNDVQCQVELRSNMHAALNSKRCLKRNGNLADLVTGRVSTYCLPIEAQNAFAPLLPVSNDSIIEPRSTMMITVRLDSFTIFESYSPGTNSVYSSLIVLFTIARMLSKQRDTILADLNNRKTANKNLFAVKNVLFALFDGESFGNIGSSSWLFYVNKDRDHLLPNSFLDKFTLDKFACVLELNQLLTTPNNKKWFVHANNWTNQQTNSYAKQLISDSKKKQLHFVKASNSDNLPTSLNVFRHFDYELSVLTLAGYDQKINDPFYHSLFDTWTEDGSISDTLDSTVDKLNNLALVVANFVFSQLTGKNDDSTIQSEKELVYNLTRCFFRLTSRCIFSDDNDHMLKLEDVLFEYSTATRSRWLLVPNVAFISRPTPRINRFEQVRFAEKQLLLFVTGRRVNCSVEPDYQHYTNLRQYKLSSQSNNNNSSTVAFNESKCLRGQLETFQLTSPYLEYLTLANENVTKLLNQESSFQYSTLTESEYATYKQPCIVIFVTPSSTYQITVLFSGMFIFVISLFFTWQIQTNYNELFCASNKTSSNDDAQKTMSIENSVGSMNQKSIVTRSSLSMTQQQQQQNKKSQLDHRSLKQTTSL